MKVAPVNRMKVSPQNLRSYWRSRDLEIDTSSLKSLVRHNKLANKGLDNQLDRLAPESIIFQAVQALRSIGLIVYLPE